MTDQKTQHIETKIIRKTTFTITKKQINEKNYKKKSYHRSIKEIF